MWCLLCNVTPDLSGGKRSSKMVVQHLSVMVFLSFLSSWKKKKNKERRGQNQEVQNQSIQHHILHMTVLRSQNQDGFQIDQCCQSRCYLSYFLLKLNWLTSLPVYSLFIVLGDITLLLWEFVCKKNNKQNLGQ